MKQREKVVPLAEGRVLEVGAGDGLNLGYLDRSKVETVFGLDNSPELLGSAEDRARALGLDFRPMLLDAENIPLEDNSMDTVLVTCTLCSVSSMRDALSEMRRILKPGGRLVFCEHGAAPDRGVYRMQRAITPIWRRFAGNCQLEKG
jgi:ubiquinone/menaquinone biosynthesis C-methylase UbiE